MQRLPRYGNLRRAHYHLLESLPCLALPAVRPRGQDSYVLQIPHHVPITVQLDKKVFLVKANNGRSCSFSMTILGVEAAWVHCLYKSQEWSEPRPV